MKILSPEVAQYLFKSTIYPCMEHCCHIWAGAPSCYLELIVKLRKRMYRTVGPSFFTSLESWLIVEMLRRVFSIGINLVDVHLNWLKWFHFFLLERRSTRYFDRFYDFSVTIPRCYKDVYFNSSFLALDPEILCL